MAATDEEPMVSQLRQTITYTPLLHVCSAFVMLLVYLSPTTHSHAAPKQVQIIVSVGNNIGFPGEEPLRYAEKDAKRFAQVFIELGDAKKERTYLLQARSPNKLKQVLAEIKGRAAELKRLQINTTLIFYYAGHGDQSNLHMGRKGLSLSHLNTLIKQIPARLKLLFIDSCRSVGGSRKMGFRRGRAFKIELTQSAPRGMATIKSASPGEPAQESDELRGAVFTHYLLSGLRGAADFDRDKQVSYHEAYLFAYSRTLLRTGGKGGVLQRPDFRMQLKGAGALILTRTHKATSTLIFPKSCKGCRLRYLIYSQPSGNVIAEVPAHPGKTTRIALPAGRFLIQRRGNRQWGVATLKMPWGGKKIVRAGDFRATRYQRLVRRGGKINDPIIELGAFYQLDLLHDMHVGLGHGGGLSLHYTLQSLLFELTVSFGHTAFTTEFYKGNAYRLSIQPAVFWLTPGRWYTLRWGLGVHISPTWRTLQQLESERLQQAGFETEETFWTTTFGAAGIIGCSIHITSRLALDLRVTGQASWFKQLDAEQESIGFDLAVRFGTGFIFTF